jgi:hypothetical protein
MKIKKYIEVLLENGIHFNTVSKMKPNQIKILAEKFETKEAVQTVQQTGYKTTITPGSQANLNINGADISVDPSKGITMMSQTKPVGTGEKAEGEVTEKFESKAQQGFFWAKCNTSKGVKKKKWCEMAKEFSDSTSKKQYKDMPEKKHPEKTVKRSTEEDYEKRLEEQIFNMIEKHIEPSMTKGELLKTIQEKVNNSEKFMLKQPKKNTMFSKNEGIEMKTMKKPIGKISSFEMKEDTKEKERTKTREKEKDKERKNPFQPKHNPAPKARKEYKEQTTAPTKPGTKERTKEKDPGKKNPFQPKHNPAPKAGKASLPNFLKWDKLGVNLK